MVQPSPRPRGPAKLSPPPQLWAKDPRAMNPRLARELFQQRTHCVGLRTPTFGRLRLRADERPRRRASERKRVLRRHRAELRSPFSSFARGRESEQLDARSAGRPALSSRARRSERPPDEVCALEPATSNWAGEVNLARLALLAIQRLLHGDVRRCSLAAQRDCVRPTARRANRSARGAK